MEGVTKVVAGVAITLKAASGWVKQELKSQKKNWVLLAQVSRSLSANLIIPIILNAMLKTLGRIVCGLARISIIKDKISSLW